MHVIVCEPNDFPEESYVMEFYPQQLEGYIKEDRDQFARANPGKTFTIYSLKEIKE